MNTVIKNLIFSLSGGLLAVGVYKVVEPEPKAYYISNERPQATPVRYVNFSGTLPEGNASFVDAAENSINTVVHIKTEIKTASTMSRDPFYDYFFGPQGGGVQQASGSGVIIKSNGYIVTNNHVIDHADKISVTLNNKKTYEAKLVGTDPSTDIAVIKIEANNLPSIGFANSDDVRIGEWVLAVGNPMNLTSTVTAGIVSAKGRSINILKGNSDKHIFPIESFIQTDAAVNPGNSGGALVNTEGKLIGINTAIASTTGSYAGYSFAVPVNIVKKVAADLIEFGVVQRGFLGVSIRDIDQELADQFKLTDSKGVYVAAINESSAASESGLKQGDVILSVGSVDVNNVPELQEQIGKYRPGEKVDVRIVRGKDEMLVPVTLKNFEGTTAKVEKAKIELRSSLGATFTPADAAELKKLDLKHGVKISSLSEGALSKVGIKKGFIITKVDEMEVKTPEQLLNALENSKGTVLLEGHYPNGTRAYYGFGL